MGRTAALLGTSTADPSQRGVARLPRRPRLRAGRRAGVPRPQRRRESAAPELVKAGALTKKKKKKKRKGRALSRSGSSIPCSVEGCRPAGRGGGAVAEQVVEGGECWCSADGVLRRHGDAAVKLDRLLADVAAGAADAGAPAREAATAAPRQSRRRGPSTPRSGRLLASSRETYMSVERKFSAWKVFRVTPNCLRLLRYAVVAAERELRRADRLVGGDHAGDVEDRGDGARWVTAGSPEGSGGGVGGARAGRRGRRRGWHSRRGSGRWTGRPGTGRCRRRAGRR